MRNKCYFHLHCCVITVREVKTQPCNFKSDILAGRTFHNEKWRYFETNIITNHHHSNDCYMNMYYLFLPLFYDAVPTTDDIWHQIKQHSKMNGNNNVFVYILLNDSVSNTNYISSKDWMLVNNKL